MKILEITKNFVQGFSPTLTLLSKNQIQTNTRDNDNDLCTFEKHRKK